MCSSRARHCQAAALPILGDEAAHLRDLGLPNDPPLYDAGFQRSQHHERTKAWSSAQNKIIFLLTKLLATLTRHYYYAVQVKRPE